MYMRFFFPVIIRNLIVPWTFLSLAVSVVQVPGLPLSCRLISLKLFFLFLRMERKICSHYINLGLEICFRRREKGMELLVQSCWEWASLKTNLILSCFSWSGSWVICPSLFYFLQSPKSWAWQTFFLRLFRLSFLLEVEKPSKGWEIAPPGQPGSFRSDSGCSFAAVTPAQSCLCCTVARIMGCLLPAKREDGGINWALLRTGARVLQQLFSKRSRTASGWVRWGCSCEAAGGGVKLLTWSRPPLHPGGLICATKIVCKILGFRFGLINEGFPGFDDAQMVWFRTGWVILRGDFSLVSAICLWWGLGALPLPVLTSTGCSRSIPGNDNLKIRLWHPAKGSDALNAFNWQSLVYAQDFSLLSLIMIPPKRKACLFSMLDILGGRQPLLWREMATADLWLGWE